MNHSSTDPSPCRRGFIGLPLLAAGMLALVAGPASALANDEHPPQREWVYKEYADVVTGDLYPAALLMTRKVMKASENASGVGYGYLSVGNYSKRPMEVTLSWDEPPSGARASNCKPSGCELTVRLGAAPAIKFIAVQDKHSPTLIVQDGRAFVSAATRHVGPIDIEVQTLRYGSISLQFVTATRLQVEEFSTPKR